MTNIYRRNSSSNYVVLLFAIFLSAITSITGFLPTSLIRAADGSPDSGPVAISLIDQFSPSNVEGTPDQVIVIPRTEWRFDGSMPSPSGKASLSTLGWQVAQDVNDLQVRDGRLIGRSIGDCPVIYAPRTVGLDDYGNLHAVEIRMSVSAGSNLNLRWDTSEELLLKGHIRRIKAKTNKATTPIVADNEMRTYVITGIFAEDIYEPSSIRHILIMPTDVNDASFEIESIRMVFYKEHIAKMPSGAVWHDQSRISRPTIIAKSPEIIRFPLTLPNRPWLDLALGTVVDDPVIFRINITPANQSVEDEVVLKRTINKPHGWEPVQVDLLKYSRQQVTLSLSLAEQEAGNLGLWGSPVIRNSGTYPAKPIKGNDGISMEPPHGVILIWADMLRWDHLNVYGYSRETAPFISKMAAEGTLFLDCLSQAPWTLPSTTSLLTSLYPTTHGVTNMYDHRLSDSATTLAEVFRDAGYATLSFSSMHYSGSGYNLGQGFEELHESNSAIEARKSSGGGTAREYVNQLLLWLETHREVPFFVFLHTYEAKGKPYPPYDTLWAESGAQEKLQTYSKKIGYPVTPEKVKQAGIDPNEFITLTKDLYDGMIRILDTEISRLFKGLEELGLDDKILVIFMSDHGQEFFDHGGEINHRGSYSEVTHVPLIVRWPGVIPQGAHIHETVRTIDVMPTILQLCRLPVPKVAQGQSLLPLFAKARGTSEVSPSIDNKIASFTTAQWRNEPAVCEYHLAGRENRRDPNYRDSHAIILDGWKLIQFFKYKEEKPERIELYNHRKDPLEQVNLADKHPEIVERLISEFNTWKEKAATAPLASDSESEQKLDSETLKRLRSLGYVR